MFNLGDTVTVNWATIPDGDFVDTEREIIGDNLGVVIFSDDVEGNYLVRFQDESGDIIRDLDDLWFYARELNKIS